MGCGHLMSMWKSHTCQKLWEHVQNGLGISEGLESCHADLTVLPFEAG